MFRDINHFTFYLHTQAPSMHLALLFTFYLHIQAPCMHLALLFTLLSTYPSSMYALSLTFYLLSFILSKGILFLFLVFRYEYRKVYRNKYLREGFDRW